MSRRLGPPAAVIAVIAVLTVFLAGEAFARWSGYGVGSGAGSTRSSVTVTLSPATAAAQLFPGGASSVKLSVTNPNAATVAVGSLSLATGQGTGGFAVDAGHASCSVAALSYTKQTNGGLGWTIPARVGAVNGSLAITLAAAVAMSSSAANACQGATFTVYLTATA